MNRTTLRDMAARLALRIAQRAGVQMDYINTAGTSVTVWGFIEQTAQTANLRGGETDDFQFTVCIPRQTSFPPSAFAPGELIRFPKTSGTKYQIDNIEPDNEDNTQSSTFKLRCGRYGVTAEID